MLCGSRLALERLHRVTLHGESAGELGNEGSIFPTDAAWITERLHVLRSQFVFKQATDGSTGAAQKTVSLKALRGLQVPKIDAAAQEAAAAKLAALWQAAEPLRRCYETQMKELGQLRQALLQKAFAWELT